MTFHRLLKSIVIHRFVYLYPHASHISLSLTRAPLASLCIPTAGIRFVLSIFFLFPFFPFLFILPPTLPKAREAEYEVSTWTNAGYQNNALKIYLNLLTKKPKKKPICSQLKSFNCNQYNHSPQPSTKISLFRRKRSTPAFPSCSFTPFTQTPPSKIKETG